VTVRVFTGVLKVRFKEKLVTLNLLVSQITFLIYVKKPNVIVY